MENSRRQTFFLNRLLKVEIGLVLCEVRLRSGKGDTCRVKVGVFVKKGDASFKRVEVQSPLD
jgi:hypothetical protein